MSAQWPVRLGQASRVFSDKRTVSNLRRLPPDEEAGLIQVKRRHWISSASSARRKKCPSGEEDGPGTVVRADDVAAPAERDRRRTLEIDVERPAVEILRRDASVGRLAQLLLPAHAEAPGRVYRKQG